MWIIAIEVGKVALRSAGFHVAKKGMKKLFD